MPNSYYQTGTGTSTGGTFYSLEGVANVTSVEGEWVVKKVKNEISPQLYFKHIKRKMGLLEANKFNSRIKRLEKAFYAAAENGQEVLGDKILKDLGRETRESAIYAKGIKLFIEREDLNKHKNHIQGGHISDTRFEKFTRVIPDDVLKAKKKVEDVFDGFIIYHYWNENEDKIRAGKQKMSDSEKNAMKDPVLFGYVNECDRLYYISEWIDELCDLTFEEIIDAIGKDEEEHTLTKDPKFTE